MNGRSPAPPDRALAARILVVDNEPGIAALLASTLRMVAYETRVVSTGRAALTAAEEFDPHLVVLDVVLPDLDGFEVAHLLWATGRQVPVLFLSARASVEDRITGLALGADDYVAKPFNLAEVILRIRAILTRSRPDLSSVAGSRLLAYADLELDESTHEVRRGNRLVALSPTEFRLLRYLLVHAESVVSKAQILNHVWRYDFGGNGRIVESYVHSLRRKLDGLGPALIQTVRGAGYTLRVVERGDR
ncbi:MULTISPECIES: response regulator transcription factor [Micromonospora]|uniref:response regulator transcription factor n=1 Tax=Micromonospora TaxID=1873 RepID=UPI0019C4FA5A|nr:response regulator transcription factor [Micromonospora yangpuensis]GGM03598.1 DNA-binding response regulator [Micromonospora yangpuensis]